MNVKKENVQLKDYNDKYFDDYPYTMKVSAEEKAFIEAVRENNIYLDFIARQLGYDTKNFFSEEKKAAFRKLHSKLSKIAREITFRREYPGGVLKRVWRFNLPEDWKGVK